MPEQSSGVWGSTKQAPPLCVHGRTRASGRRLSETRSARVAEPAWIVDRAQPERGGGMNIEFLSTVAVIAPDPPVSRKLYVDTLGLPRDSEGGDYHDSEQIAG